MMKCHKCKKKLDRPFEKLFSHCFECGLWRLEKLTPDYDPCPACVKPDTKQKLIERGWAKDLSKKGAAIEQMKSAILSDMPYDEKRKVIENRVIQNNLEPFSQIIITNLNHTYKHGEKITFELTNFGYRDWCLMPSIHIYYNGHQEPVYEGAISHSCPPPDDNPGVYIGTWSQDDFLPDVPFCRYEGLHTITGESFEFESQVIGKYYCNGKDDFSAPKSQHQEP